MSDDGAPLPLARRAGVVAVVYLATALPAALAAAPAARAAAQFVGHDPRGDALFWRPGGAWLVEAGRRALDAAPVVLPLAPWALALWALSLVVPWGLLLVALTTQGPLRRETAGVALLGRLGPLATLTAASALARGAAVALGLGVAGELGPALAGPDAGPRARDLLALGLALAAPLGYALARWVHDLALAACVRRGERAGPALVTALGTAYQAPRRALAPWLASTLAQGACVAGAAWAVGHLVGGAYEWPAVALLHQATLLALVVARAWWLRRALALVGPPWPPPHP
jgi:hypothetical protein